MEKFNIFDFIEHTRQNKENYICYCEVIIDPYGNVIEARPSHQEAVLTYVMELEGKSRKEVCDSIPTYCSPLDWCLDKYGLVAVWYECYIYGVYKYFNRFQRRTINILKNNGLVSDVIRQIPTEEYKLYLYRKSIGYE